MHQFCGLRGSTDHELGERIEQTRPTTLPRRDRAALREQVETDELRRHLVSLVLADLAPRGRGFLEAFVRGSFVTEFDSTARHRADLTGETVAAEVQALEEEYGELFAEAA